MRAGSRLKGCLAGMVALLTAATLTAAVANADDDVTPSGGPDLPAVERMAGFFAQQLATSGGYVYAYSADLSVRRGEGGEAEPGVIWNQPPGTPAIGGAFLRLYELTGEEKWLDAAGAAVKATLDGQLLSGGWYNSTETLPERRADWCYRVRIRTPDACKALEANKVRNNATLDDNITQSNLGFLMWYDALAQGRDPAVREAVDYGLGRLLKAQYPNGAWPVFLDRIHPHDRFAAAWRARLPQEWPREWAKPPGSALVLNDQLALNMMQLLLAADRQFGREELIAAARRTGDFLLSAQLPAPQRGWAQTYNLDLEPIWGRKFEPPSVASRETAGAIEAMLALYQRTGERRYVDGAKEAAGWLRDSRLPSGEWARFYELGTNQPLYIDSDETLTYDNTKLHRGYGFSGRFGIDATLDRVERVAAGEKPEPSGEWDWIFEPTPYAREEIDLSQVRVDAEGRFVEDGWIRSDTFIRAVRALGMPPADAKRP
jgi:hypothetical protein